MEHAVRTPHTSPSGSQGGLSVTPWGPAGAQGPVGLTLCGAGMGHPYQGLGELLSHLHPRLPEQVLCGAGEGKHSRALLESTRT